MQEKIELSFCRFTGRRLEVRSVYVRGGLRKLKEKMEPRAKIGKVVTYVNHGGGVCNSYGYPAQTEAFVLVGKRVRGGWQVCASTHRIPANKATLRGAAAKADDDIARLYDERCNEGTRVAARCRISENFGHICTKADVCDFWPLEVI